MLPASALCKARVYALGLADRIPLGEGRRFDVGGRAVAVFRTRDGALHASQALCPHREGPLADGLVGGGLVVCPLHGYKYDLATGRPMGNDCPALRTFQVEQTGSGELLLRIEEEP